MTNQEKIKEVMIQHLRLKGYPNMTPQQVLAELKPMWMKLGEAGLLPKGASYQSFVQVAQAESHYMTLKEAMMDDLLKHFKKR